MFKSIEGQYVCVCLCVYLFSQGFQLHLPQAPAGMCHGSPHHETLLTVQPGYRSHTDSSSQPTSVMHAHRQTHLVS